MRERRGCEVREKERERERVRVEGGSKVREVPKGRKVRGEGRSEGESVRGEGVCEVRECARGTRIREEGEVPGCKLSHASGDGQDTMNGGRFT